MPKSNKIHNQPSTHPFRRYVPSTSDNERDELFVIAHSSIIGYRGGSLHRSHAGGGR